MAAMVQSRSSMYVAKTSSEAMVQGSRSLDLFEPTTFVLVLKT